MGTQPTNAGIDFQQRVSAWMLINMVAEIDLANSIDVKDHTYIEKVAFETQDIIDDLVITTKENEKLFFQMKRTVSFSKSEDSDFFKAINQFVRQYIKEGQKVSNYVLVTTSNSSNPVKNELRKILESIRINPLTFIENPLNQSERSTFDRFKGMITGIYKDVTKKEMSELQFLELASKIIISVLDIEDGMTFEKSVLLTINGYINSTSPKLFWSLLIKNCLTYASSRMSVLKSELKETWKVYSDKPLEGNNKDEEILEEYLKLILGDSEFASGKDVVLVGGDEELGEGFSNKMLMMELYRFNDDGTRRTKYVDDNYLILKNGMQLKVIHRTSTNIGMERFIEENIENLPYEEIIIVPAKNIEKVEEDEYVTLHREWCIKYIEENKKQFYNCLHCGKGISDNYSYVIEADDLEDQSILGIVHKDCLRPVDRVLGVLKSKLFEEYSCLKKFDYNLWIKSIKDSQAMLVGAKGSKMPPLVHMAWDPFGGANKHFKHCIKMLLNNGDFVYTKNRGKVDRLNKSEARKVAKRFNETIARNRESDPVGYTSKNYVYGHSSYLLRMKNDDEEILECVHAQVTNYTEHIGKQYDNNRSYYAPLITISLLEEEEELTINNKLVFISNPLNLEQFIKNWSQQGIEINEYELNIISSDEEFDHLMRKTVKEGMGAVIDPILDSKREFVQGFVLEDINSLKNSLK